MVRRSLALRDRACFDKPLHGYEVAKGLFRNKFGLSNPTDNGGDGRNQLKKAELIFKQLPRVLPSLKTQIWPQKKLMGVGWTLDKKKKLY